MRPSCASARARKTRFFWPPRQFADLAVAVGAHADALQRLVDLVAVGARRHAQEIHVAVAAHHHHGLDQHREIPVDILALRHIGDDVLLQRLVDRQAAEPHLAGGRLHEAHDRLEERRLAAAVDADQRADGAGIEFEDGVAHGGEAVRIGDAEIAHRDAGAAASASIGEPQMPCVGCIHLPKPLAMVSTVTLSRSRIGRHRPVRGAAASRHRARRRSARRSRARPAWRRGRRSCFR